MVGRMGRVAWKHVHCESEKWKVTQSCLTLCDPMRCSPPGSSIHGIFQARVLEWVAISFSRGSSWFGDRTWVSRIAGRRFIIWATRESLNMYTIICKIDSQWEFAIWLRELNPGLCDKLEGWDGVGGGREVREGEDTCIPMADPCWCMAEAYTIL